MDRAIAEAAAFVLTFKASTADSSSYTIEARSLVDVAKLLLRDAGLADTGLREQILRRLQSRAGHRDRRQFVNHSGVDDPVNVRQPRRGGEPWTDRDVELINRVVRSTRSPNA